MQKKHSSLQPPPLGGRSEENEGAPSDTTRVLDKSTSLVLLDGKDRLSALCDFQRAENDTWLEALLLVQWITQQGICTNAETKELKLSILANILTTIVRRDSLFVTKVCNKLFALYLRKIMVCLSPLPCWWTLSRR